MLNAYIRSIGASKTNMVQEPDIEYGNPNEFLFNDQ